MSRPVHFEIHASDPQALMDFYGELFGWAFNKWSGGEYWMISTGPDDRPGINGGLLPRHAPRPPENVTPNAFVITVDVEDLDAALDKAHAISDRAAVCVPRMAVAGIGWLAYMRDPDGNVFGMMQPDPNAA
ncbi:VOC family protein [Massilia horti]|uniref:VOC family protein n=1 Tax=Massilia horti TaxID=2562153 RepID=A0A4Y9T5U6_9BURK|nr:VOC family protein [Massilia horti]TFW32433.1 VOC family protein [Massilia horti]